MKKSDIIEAIAALDLDITDNPSLENLVKQLKSQEVDIFIWNDISAPMPCNGKYLISNGKETNTMLAVEINSNKEHVNHELYWVNKQCRIPYIKWAKMPEYKV